MLMKRRDLMRSGAAVVVLATAMIGLGGPAGMGSGGAALAQTKMVFKASDVHADGYPTVVAIQNFGKKLSDATNGRLSVQMFAAMQLGGEKEAIEQAQVGAIQIARVSVGALGPVVDDLNVFNMPFLFRDTAHMQKVIDGKVGQDLLAKVTASPAGLIDGAENNPPSFYFDNHYQVAKFYTLTEHLIVPEMVVFSKKTWDSLSKDDQALVTKFSQEMQLDERTLWEAKEKDALDKMKAAGIEIDTIADKKPFQDAVKPVWDKYGTKYAELIKQIQAVQ